MWTAQILIADMGVQTNKKSSKATFIHATSVKAEFNPK